MLNGRRLTANCPCVGVRPHARALPPRDGRSLLGGASHGIGGRRRGMATPGEPPIAFPSAAEVARLRATRFWESG